MRSLGLPYHVHAFIAETTGFTMMGVRDCSGAGRVEGDALGAQSQMARRRIYEGDDGHVAMGLRGAGGGGRGCARGGRRGGCFVAYVLKVVMSWRSPAPSVR
jgi:hypothetical protein